MTPYPLPATSTMSPGTMSRARMRCTPLRSARITFPISGSYSFNASMALSAFLSCKQRGAELLVPAGSFPTHCKDRTPKPWPWLWNAFTPRMGQAPSLLQPLQNDSCWFESHQILGTAWIFGADHLTLGLGSSVSQLTAFFPIQQLHLSSSCR